MNCVKSVILKRIKTRASLNIPSSLHILLMAKHKFLVMQELWSVHADTGKFSAKDLEVCATCQQVLSAADLDHHVGSHTLENHFPALGSSEPVPPAWGKK
jgi:hypothetical protein